MALLGFEGQVAQKSSFLNPSREDLTLVVGLGREEGLAGGLGHLPVGEESGFAVKHSNL